VLNEPVSFGRYTLIRRIAQGGMAQIYLAVQRGPHGFEKVAVLKVILPELTHNEDFVRMFLDEARIAANLDHNNVVRVYDFGEIDGQYFIAMEHLPGEDLASLLQQVRKSGKPMPVDVAADIIAHAATGLHFAHELKDSRGRLMNVVHRDVSPSNVIITYHGTVKLVDFGIARAETNLTKTEAGTLKGKVAYVSPEQAQGEPLDRRSDVWALGTVLHELLTGVRVFKRASDLKSLEAVAHAPVPSTQLTRPDVPDELDRIVLKAMARPLDERYQTAAELEEDLAAFLVGAGYVRSERKLADFMSQTFDAERRDAKLLISQAQVADGAPILATPSQLKRLPLNLAPIRSHSELPAAFTADSKTAIAPDSVVVRRQQPLLLVGFAALAVVSTGVAAALLLRNKPQQALPPEPAQPVVVAPAEAKPAPAPAPAPEPAVVAEAPEPAPAPKPEKPRPAPPKAAARGKMTIDTVPWSEVFLNGKKLGDTPLVDYPMPAGLHVLKLVNEDKGLKSSVEIEVQPGKTTVKKLKL
jgi:eukaryotic-like serine/threonine-protein kinase